MCFVTCGRGEGEEKGKWKWEKSRSWANEKRSKQFDFAGRGLKDQYYDVGFDTLYVLSDGAPSWGEVTDRDEILRRVRETNRLRRLTINCITFGDQNETEFLKKLAEENGGRHMHVD